MQMTSEPQRLIQIRAQGVNADDIYTHRGRSYSHAYNMYTQCQSSMTSQQRFRCIKK